MQNLVNSCGVWKFKFQFVLYTCRMINGLFRRCCCWSRTISEICRMFPAVPPLNRGEKNVSAYISANFFFFFVFIPFVLLWKKKKNAYKICVYNIYHHCCIEYARPCCVAPQTTMTTVAICAKWKSGAAVAGESGYIIRLRNAINV